MMKKTTKLLSVILALCLVVSLLPGMALAATSYSVDTATKLKDALSTAKDGDTITLTGSFSISELAITKAITLNGNGNTLTFSGSATKGIEVTAAGATIKSLTVSGPNKAGVTVETGCPGISVIDTGTASTVKTVTLSAVKVTGADVGIKVSNAFVTMTGTIDVSGNDFGGIYAADASKLVLTGATLKRTDEDTDKPVLFKDDSENTFTFSTSQSLFNSGKNYYLTGDATVKQTITTTSSNGTKTTKTESQSYCSLKDALIAANAAKSTADTTITNVTLTLLKDVKATEAVAISNDLILDLGGKTLSLGANSISVSSTYTLTVKNGKITAEGNAIAVNGGTLRHESTATVTGSTKTENAAIVIDSGSSADIAGKIVSEKGNGLENNGNTTIETSASITATGYIGLLNNDGILAVKGGTFTGKTGAKIAGGAVTITTGTFIGTTSLETTVTGVTITTGYFQGKVSLAEKNLTSGYFTVNPSEYLKDKYIAAGSDNKDYTYKVKAATLQNVEVKVGAPVVPTGTSTTATYIAAKTVAFADGDAPLVAAAGNVAASLTSSDLTDATAKLKAAGVTIPEGTTPTIVIQPYIKTTVGSYSSSEKTLSVSIETLYNKIVTLNPDNMVYTGSSKNSLMLNGSTPLTLSFDNGPTVKLSFQIPSAIAGTATNSVYPDLLVKHTKSSTTNYYYTAKVTKENSNYYATFTTTHGFSTFTLQSSRDVSITFDRTASGSTGTHSKTYGIGSIGTSLPTFTGCIGWTFTSSDKTAISGTYTKVTDELWSALMNTESGSTIKAAAVTAGSVDIKASTYGKVTADKTTGLKKDDVVTLTVTPNSGYVLKTLVVSSANGYVINYTTVITNSKYTFKMPAENVTVTATFATNFPFKDVILSDWYYDEVKYAYDKGLVSGLDATTFGPENTTTRGMVVTLLHRMSGSPSIATDNTFTDVSNSMYYAKPIVWANYNEIVTGYGKNKFGPEDNITREQMATILYKYVQYRGKSVTGAADLSSFTDSSKISSYAKTAMSWAVAKGLINGMGNGTIAPQGAATRAQVAAILMRLDQNIL